MRSYSKTTYLLDILGHKVHEWKSSWLPGQVAYLLPNGNLLRPTRGELDWPQFAKYQGRRIQMLAWDGTLVWDYLYSNSTQYLQHHDVAPLPNGNVLLLVWERKTKAELIAAGRDPSKIPFPEMWANHVVEIKPTGVTTGQVVWRWNIWDHMVQEYDSNKPNYGKVKDHPELLDINHPGLAFELNHGNAIAYNSKLDQIMLSYLAQNELIIIDHSTTTQQAAGHTGGTSGKGGDILYRWGNPANYRAGVDADRYFWGLHDPNWVAPGRPGAGNILVFDNGMFRPGGLYATVVELKPPINAAGSYTLKPGAAFGPAAPTWIYKDPTTLHSGIISGAERLPNGNTLIVSGQWGTYLEVTPAGKIVWKYVTPMDMDKPVKQGTYIPFDMVPSIFNMVFKPRRYAPDYPGLQGKNLSAKGVIELPANGN